MLLPLASLALAVLPQDFGRLRSLTTEHVRDPVAYDLDNDGDLDLLGDDLDLPLFATRAVGLFNDGTGRFTRGQLGATAKRPDSGQPYLVADFSGDLLPDVLSLPSTGLAPDLIVGIGGGRFAGASAGVAALTGFRRGEVADVDLDGDLDLYGWHEPGAVTDTLFLNDGSGVFSAAPVQPASARADDAVFIDYDGDGDPDLAIEESPDRLLENDGTGVFVSGPTLPSISFFAWPMQVVDWDGDGDLDIMSPRSWFSNEGDGVFIDQGIFLTSSKVLYFFTDFTGDGLPDVLAKPESDPFLEESIGIDGFAGIGGGIASFVSLGELDPLRTELFGLAFGDWDGDGDVDLYLRTSGGSFVAFNRGSGSFEIGLASPEDPSSGLNDVRAVDLDGDGRLDVVGRGRSVSSVAGLDDDTLYWIQSQADSRFAPPEPVPGAGARAKTFALLDLFADGAPDVLSGSNFAGASTHRLFENDGSGSFVDVSQRIVTSLPTQPVSRYGVGDLDQDGLDDVVALFVGTLPSSGAPDEVWRGTSQGGLTAFPAALGAADVGSAVVLSDLDLDGDLDFAALDGFSSRFYTNDGASVFSSGSPAPGFGFGALDDLTQDGFPDYVVYDNQDVVVYANDGSGAFPAPPFASLSNTNGAAGQILLFDVDQDGLRDIVLADGGYWRNLGGGAFNDLTETLPPGATQADRGDFDGDGDEDLWLGSGPRVNWNLKRQLAWRTWPRVGRPLTMDVYGARNTLWGLWASTGLANLPSKFGVFQLDLTQGGRAAIGNFGDARRDTVTFLIPADSSLIGLDVFWQALIGAPYRWSNLEVTRLSDS